MATQTAISPVTGLTAEDQAYLDREVDGIGAPGTRRAFLGRLTRAIGGFAACGAIATGIAEFGEGPAGFVGRAEGAQQAVPRPTPLPEIASLAPRAVTSTPADRREWDMFRRRFIAADGRVIDTGNNAVSHTEGQGWGLLFSVAFDDQASFQRILDWTTANLSRPHDALHAWRYCPGTVPPVADLNNATDGDLYIACALWRASFRWNRPDYAVRAQAIARDILRLLVRRAGDRTVLLPAAFGFERDGAVVVNPSYYCFTAMQELAQAAPSPLWGRLTADGLAMIAEGRFGAWHLPPDWLSVRTGDGSLSPASGYPARFSYDAIRVPLHLAWSGLTQPALRDAFVRYWPTAAATPAWVDLRTNVHASYPASPGIVAVARMATATARTALPLDFPSIRSSPDYYSAALTLLARLAWQETAQA